MKQKLNQMLSDQKNAHIFYSFSDTQKYIQNTIAYILDGIESGDSVLLIESERMLPQILIELEKHLDEKDEKRVHHISNFDFYFSSGSYHPPAIFKYIENSLQPFLDHNIPVRTWTHVEWSTIEGPLSIVEELEEGVDKLIAELNLKVMCAYKEVDMPDPFKLALLRTHKYVMTDDDLFFSDQYKENDLKVISNER
ncbi:MEDS domain-containing protein [Bacillus sp. NEB1478]|uniref:MEDS domain-containing protein n=1 Tax=Bacillus sp. NEB1478 TaxID=3073816 RepID=UPI002872FEAE|nr:MEDS domain-containing protein [Bacillus sp. NEB1478]WNB90710.1 MEDS domain-containing protein [Bacillus sp. NEB1478]